MEKRHRLFVGAVLLLLLPIIPVLATVNIVETIDYQATAHGESLGTTGSSGNWNEYSNQQATWSFLVEGDWRYVAVLAGFGGCCPELPDGSSLNVRITGPGNQEYGFRVENGECHNGDRDCGEENDGGHEWIILVEPEIGAYQITIQPRGTMQELPSNKHTVVASTWATNEMGNDIRIRGNHIWWYYPDGSSKYVEDGGFLDWQEAWPRILGYSVLALVGWAGSVVLLVRARRLR